MRRRGLLLGLGAAVVAAPSGSAERALLDLFTDRTRGVALGAAYLTGLQRVPSAPELAAELAAAVWSGLSGRGGLRRQVAARIGDDFTQGRVVCVDGWVLSVTEARICGLAALAMAGPTPSERSSRNAHWLS